MRNDNVNFRFILQIKSSKNNKETQKIILHLLAEIQSNFKYIKVQLHNVKVKLILRKHMQVVKITKQRYK